MAKELSEMTLTEMWELFPIVRTEHSAFWETWYRDEAEHVLDAIKLLGCRISHIGSTAISGICAKPIVDILLELPAASPMNEVKEALVRSGYTCMREKAGRADLNKGYTNQGFAEKVFHLHLRYLGDNDELYFRDYMNENPVLAKQYEALKLSLWKQYEHNRDAYTDAKGAFVTEQTRAAKLLYGKRYGE